MPRWVYRALLLLALGLVILQVVVPADVRYPLVYLTIFLVIVAFAGRWPRRSA